MSKKLVGHDVSSAYNILLPEEERIILNARDLREKMINAFIEKNGGVPDNSRDIRLVNEVLNSVDAQTLGLVDRRLKSEENKQMEDVSGMVAEIFMNMQKPVVRDKNIPIDLPDIFLPNDLVPGEDTIEYQELSMDDIRKDN